MPAVSRYEPRGWIGGPRPGGFSEQRRVVVKVAILSLALFVAGAVSVRAEDEIKVSDLPKDVAAAVKAKFPKGEMTKASKEEEDGKTIYEVVVESEGTTLDVSVSDKGKLLEIEKTIAAEKLPEAVASAIKAKYPEAKIKKAEEIIKFESEPGGDEEEKLFEVVLATSGKPDVEVKLSPSGKIIEDDEEDKAEKKKDKDEKPGNKKD
jgi:hypothetical protein